MTKNLHFIQTPQALKAMNGLKAPKEWPQRERKTYHWVLDASAFRNKDPAKEAEQPGRQGNRPESGRWRKEVKALPKKGSPVSNTAGATITPQTTRPICAPQSMLLSSFAISPPDLHPQGWIQIGNASFRTYSSEDGNLSDFSFTSVFLPRLISLSVVSF